MNRCKGFTLTPERAPVHFSGRAASARLVSGFTLIEVMIVMAIVGLVSAALTAQFSRSRVDFDQAISALIADVRLVQLWAASGQQHGGAYRCGYGVHFISATDYVLYAGANAQSVNCSTDNRNYDGGTLDAAVRTVTLTNSRYDFQAPLAPDIFFEPPNPVTYLNNESSPTTLPARIILHTVNANCASDASQCRAVCVYRSGKIQVAPNWTTCP